MVHSVTHFPVPGSIECHNGVQAKVIRSLLLFLAFRTAGLNTLLKSYS